MNMMQWKQIAAVLTEYIIKGCIYGTLKPNRDKEKAGFWSTCCFINILPIAALTRQECSVLLTAKNGLF